MAVYTKKGSSYKGPYGDDQCHRGFSERRHREIVFQVMGE